MSHYTPTQIFCAIVVLFFGIGIHEYSHAKFAELAGDPTPRSYGRVTLQLWKHFEPVGTMMMVLSSLTGFGIGWGRPCPMDPRKMRNPRVDFFIAVIAGPMSNLVQAMVYGTALKFALASQAPSESLFVQLCVAGLFINLGLCFFNLLPIFPLDGNWLLGLLLPDKVRIGYQNVQRQVGMIVLLILIITDNQLHLIDTWIDHPTNLIVSRLFGNIFTSN